MSYQKRAGFTLIELLVVIAIIGILAALAVVALGSSRARARDAKRIDSVKKMTSALEIYYDSVGRYPDPSEITAGNTLVNPEDNKPILTIPKLPDTPDGSCAQTGFTYALNVDGSYLIDFCLGDKVSDLAGGPICATAGGFKNGACGGVVVVPPSNNDSCITGNIYYLEDLDNVRNCLGNNFTLINNLDFNNSASYKNGTINTAWTTGEGWVPLGDINNSYQGQFEGNNKTISNLYIKTPSNENILHVGLFSIISSSIKNLSLVNANVTGTSGFTTGSLVGFVNNYNNIDVSIENSNVIGGTVKEVASGTYHISQLNEQNIFEEVYQKHFPVNYATEEFEFNNLNNSLSLEIKQSGKFPFAGIDAVVLKACSKDIVATSAVYVDTNQSVLVDISKHDKNVIIANDKTVRVNWQLPKNCTSATMSLTANEYGQVTPFKFVVDNKQAYQLGSKKGALKMDGQLDEIKGLTANYSPYWTPASGHPADNIYVYVRDDESYVYFSTDITIDNTDDHGPDWLAVTINGQKFLVNDIDNTYGVCGFGLTDKVSYKHQTCEMKIPKTALGDQVTSMPFIMEYYGTGGSFSPEGIGGLIGCLYNANVRDLRSENVVIGNRVTGGLIGASVTMYQAPATIINCNSSSSVTGKDGVGGLVAATAGSDVYNSYATGNVTGTISIGGLIGSNADNASVFSSYATGTVTFDNSCNDCWRVAYGGLIGMFHGNSIVDSYATGQIIGHDNVGGLVGDGYGTITNSYATGQATGNNYVGGLIGQGSSDTKVTNSYATGLITGNTNVGGLIGGNELGSIQSLVNSYWNKETTGQLHSFESDDATGKTTAEMKSQLTFVDWNFEDIWQIQNSAYPSLRNKTIDPAINISKSETNYSDENGFGTYVTLSSATDAVIYYEISTTAIPPNPTSSSTRYTGTINVPENYYYSIKAIAYRNGSRSKMYNNQE